MLKKLYPLGQEYVICMISSDVTYTTHNKLRIFGYGFKFFGELYMSCTNDFVCDYSIVLWYEMYLFGVVSFIVLACHACK